jgi:hypothetical protein
MQSAIFDNAGQGGSDDMTTTFDASVGRRQRMGRRSHDAMEARRIVPPHRSCDGSATGAQAGGFDLRRQQPALARPVTGVFAQILFR